MTIRALPESNVETAINGFIEDYLNLIKNESQSNLVKNGTSNTGKLSQSAIVELNKEEFSGFLLYQAPYAAYVEFGTNPHRAPLGRSLPYKAITRGRNKGRIRITSTPSIVTNPLDWWAWRRGVRFGMHCWLNKRYYGVHTTLGWGVWKKILRFGSDPHPFLRPAIDFARGRMNQIARKNGVVVS